MKVFDLETKWGHAKIVPVSLNCTYFDANTNCLSDESVGLTINGIRYAVSAHYVRDAGVWRIQTTQNGAPSLYMAKVRLGRSDPTAAARRTVLENVGLVVAVWAKDHEQDLAEAEVESLRDRLDAKLEELEELEGEHRECSVRIAELESWHRAAVDYLDSLIRHRFEILLLDYKTSEEENVASQD